MLCVFPSGKEFCPNGSDGSFRNLRSKLWYPGAGKGDSKLLFMAHWIFQSTPDYFDLPGALKEAPLHDNVLMFLARQCAEDIAPGDTVYMCFGGRKSPGVYATATVLTYPTATTTEEWQRKYGMKQHQAEAEAEFPLRVQLKIKQLLDVPIARGDIYRLPELAGHKLRQSAYRHELPAYPRAGECN